MYRRFVRLATVVSKCALRGQFRAVSVLPPSYSTNTWKMTKTAGIMAGIVATAFFTVAIASVLEKKDVIAICQEDDDVRTNRRNLPLTRNFVADVVEAVSPAVVNIVSTSNGFMGVGSSGSGFIIHKEGYVVTNAHVVANGDGDYVIVTMKSGRKRRASVHSMDILSDIAIVKLEDVDDELLPIAPLGHSSKVRSGEFVIAIGSPMLLQNSASLGIVSATARHASELGISNNRSEYIQTDAAVNVGNSGGPLVNLDGEVIGINTLKVKGTDGISLAIPIDIASQIIKQLLANKKVTRPFVGLKMAEMVAAPAEYSTNKKYRKAHKYPNLLQDTKVVVLDVQKNSPAALGGLQSGDIILGVNDKDVHSVRDVLDEIGLEVGKQLDLRVMRSDQERYVTLTTAPETAKRF